MTVEQLISRLGYFELQAEVDIRAVEGDKQCLQKASGVEDHTKCTHSCDSIGKVLIR